MLIVVPALIAVTIGWSRSRPAVNVLGLRPETPSRLPDFSFTNQHGQVVTRKDLHGRVCLVTFAFTSCGTTCRQVARNLSRALQRFAGESNVCLVTWTIDPRTDTPPVLLRFSLTAGATNLNWMFLTGSSQNIADIIQNAFPSATVPAGWQSYGNRLPDMSRVFVLDKAGQLRGSADGLATNLLTVLERAVLTLRAESSPPQF
jgi:protein SCO1/2